jgi:hypothetical protein
MTKENTILPFPTKEQNPELFELEGRDFYKALADYTAQLPGKLSDVFQNKKMPQTDKRSNPLRDYINSDLHPFKKKRALSFAIRNRSLPFIELACAIKGKHLTKGDFFDRYTYKVKNNRSAGDYVIKENVMGTAVEESQPNIFSIVDSIIKNHDGKGLTEKELLEPSIYFRNKEVPQRPIIATLGTDFLSVLKEKGLTPGKKELNKSLTKDEKKLSFYSEKPLKETMDLLLISPKPKDIFNTLKDGETLSIADIKPSMLRISEDNDAGEILEELLSSDKFVDTKQNFEKFSKDLKKRLNGKDPLNFRSHQIREMIEVIENKYPPEKKNEVNNTPKKQPKTKKKRKNK